MNNQRLDHIFFVHAYGHWDPSIRDDVQMEGLEGYLREYEEMAQGLQDLGCNVRTHFVGGIKDQNGITEAQSWKAEVLRRYASQGVPDFYQGIRCLDGTNHFECAEKVLLEAYSIEQEAPAKTIVSYCVDWVRAPLVQLLLKKLHKELRVLETDLGVLVRPIPRVDNHPNSQKAYQEQLLKTLEGMSYVELEQFYAANR